MSTVTGEVTPPAPPSAARRAPAPAPEKPRHVPIGDRRVPTLIIRLCVLGTVLFLWQIAPQSILPNFAFGKPILGNYFVSGASKTWYPSVLSQLWLLIHTGKLFPSLLATFLGVLYGMLVAAPLGTIIGLLCSSKLLRWFLVPFVTVGNAVPKIGLISLFIIALGVNIKTHIALVVSITMFVYYYSIRQALDEVDPNKLVAMRLMGAGRFKIVKSLIFRSAAPQLFAASRIALPLAFTAEIFSELRVPTSTGLGVLLQDYTNALNGPGSIAVLIIVMLIGYAIDVILGARLRSYTDSIGAGIRT